MQETPCKKYQNGDILHLVSTICFIYITMRNYKSDFITNPTTKSVLPANMDIDYSRFHADNLCLRQIILLRRKCKILVKHEGKERYMYGTPSYSEVLPFEKCDFIF